MTSTLLLTTLLSLLFVMGAIYGVLKLLHKYGTSFFKSNNTTKKMTVSSSMYIDNNTKVVTICYEGRHYIIAIGKHNIVLIDKYEIEE